MVFDCSVRRLDRRCRASILAIVLLLVAGMVHGGWEARAGVASREEMDLAALLIHSDDLDWMVEEKIRGTAENTPYGAQYSAGLTQPREAVLAQPYAIGRGGFTLLDMSSSDPQSLLTDAGWLRSR